MMSQISVIIPTYNRSQMLLQCLDALEKQSIPRDTYEILVIDDHSPDDTPQRMAERVQEYGERAVRFFRQEKNGGPSAARNVGIRNARGEWLLFLDDDILVAPNTLELHLNAHRAQPGENVAVLGVTRVAPGTSITPLMRYMLESGKSPLIDSKKITDPNNVPFGYFQTNTSVARNFLLAHGSFDEELRFAYGEDTELAYRLQQVGMRIVFRPEIVVDHHGVLSYNYARQRARTAGKVAIMTYRKHPEWLDIRFLNYGTKSKLVIQGKRFLAEQLLDPLLLAADSREWDSPALQRACGFCLGMHQLAGMLDTARAEHFLS